MTPKRAVGVQVLGLQELLSAQQLWAFLPIKIVIITIATITVRAAIVAASGAGGSVIAIMIVMVTAIAKNIAAAIALDIAIDSVAR